MNPRVRQSLGIALLGIVMGACVMAPDPPRSIAPNSTVPAPTSTTAPAPPESTPAPPPSPVTSF